MTWSLGVVKEEPEEGFHTCRAERLSPEYQRNIQLSPFRILLEFVTRGARLSGSHSVCILSRFVSV